MAQALIAMKFKYRYCDAFFLSSATCDEKLPKARELAGQGKLTEALDMLMALEKQTRFFVF